jgi:mono/diheme cytochrome c family protein
VASRFVLLALLGTTLVVGCGEEPIPAAPTFEVDIKPIMLAHCVRCHGAGGTLNADPRTVDHTPPPRGYLDHFDDQGDCTLQPDLTLLPSCKWGALTEHNVIKLFIHLRKDQGRMPPPPSDGLSDRQIEILDRWVANPLP